MDHIFFEGVNQTPAPTVPYYEPFDGAYEEQSSEAYCQSVHILSLAIKDRWQAEDDGQLTPDQTLEPMIFFVLQEWLFFGFLHQFAQVFGVPIRRDDWIVPRPEGSGRLQLSTARLRSFAAGLLHRIRGDMAEANVTIVTNGDDHVSFPEASFWISKRRPQILDSIQKGQYERTNAC